MKISHEFEVLSRGVLPWLGQKTAQDLVGTVIASRGEYDVTIRQWVAAEFRRQAGLPGHEGVKDKLLKMAAMMEP
jgi:hypothetical protein